jgi:hypothetical protein
VHFFSLHLARSWCSQAHWHGSRACQWRRGTPVAVATAVATAVSDALRRLSSVKYVSMDAPFARVLSSVDDAAVDDAAVDDAVCVGSGARTGNHFMADDDIITAGARGDSSGGVRSFALMTSPAAAGTFVTPLFVCCAHTPFPVHSFHTALIHCQC